MKLYMHPVSMTSRPVRLFIAENGIAVDEQMVDLMAGEHYHEPFTAINPSRQVPVLEDGDFRLTESSAILKYLADKIDSPAYPKGLKQRAKVNEMMDWFNTTFYRDYAYGWIYPQLFPHHRRPTEEVQRATIAWGKERAKDRLQILERLLAWPGQVLSVRRSHHHRRPLRQLFADLGRGDSLRLLGLSEHCALARQHEAAAELAQGQRGAVRLRRGGQGPEVRGSLIAFRRFGRFDGFGPEVKARTQPADCSRCLATGSPISLGFVTSSS